MGIQIQLQGNEFIKALDRSVQTENLFLTILSQRQFNLISMTLQSLFY